MTERDYSEFSPEELSGEFLKIFEMLPVAQSVGGVAGRERSEVRGKLKNKLDQIFKCSYFCPAARDYLMLKFSNLWVSGFDPKGSSNSSFAEVLYLIKVSKNGITDPKNVQLVEEATFGVLHEEINDLKKYIPYGFAAELDKKHEIKKLEGLSEKWIRQYEEKYSEKLVLPNEA